MFQSATSTALPPHRIETTPPIIRIPDTRARREEQLPFTVRVVRNEEDLLKAVQIRHSAYARHMPVFAEKLRMPESADSADDVTVLLAESKLDGSPLGTARLQTNRYRPLSMEESVVLPPWIQGKSLADIRRLGIVQGTIGRLVKMILIKACFQFCERNDVDWAVIAARPPLDRSYEQLMFEDILPGETFIPLPRAANVPHRVMAFEIASGEARWTRAKHPLLDFFCNTDHPDIDVSQAQDIGVSYRHSPASDWLGAPSR